MKPLVALYKAYRGGEWFGASLESICQHVDGVVVMQATRPYRPGPARQENTAEVVRQFAVEHPLLHVVAEQLDVIDQADHYKRGLEIIRQRFGADAGVLVIDTDEVWPDATAAEVAGVIRSGSAPYYVARLFDYIKSPFWRTSNEAGHFVAGLGSASPPELVRTRFGGWQRHQFHRFGDGVRLHHFTLVREDESEIPEKMSNCAHADGAYHNDWMERVWEKLPAGSDLHPSPGWERTWPKIDLVSEADLPQAVVRCARSAGLLDKHKKDAT